MSVKYYLADAKEIDKRQLLAKEFYENILDPHEIPYMVTDDASLYDIFVGDEQELIKKIKENYGVKIDITFFKISFWKLLDYLEANKDK